jgi:hypothetical protein
MTLVSPSYNQACSARDASRARFERQNPDAELDATTVKNDTAHLGGTVVTVRNYLNASAAAAHSEIDALDDAFAAASGSKSESDITKPLQDLDRLFAKTEAFIEGMLNPQFPEASLSDAKRLIDEARGHMSDSELVHDTRCTSAQAALRLLGESMNLGFDSLQGHMNEAEVSYRNMADKNNMVQKTADMLKSQGETVLCSLDTVLQHGLDAKPEAFNMDGFVQLLYSKNALGATIAAAANRYTASQEDIALFHEAIKTTSGDDKLYKVAQDISNRMFRDSNSTPIDFGSYLKEILGSVPTAQEALKAAMKYMIPISRVDRNSLATG